MHTNERFDLILDYLKMHKRATVADLSKLVYVSEATVRRDLNEMQRMGLLRRTHGGAMYSDGSEEVSIFVRQEVNATGKEITASIALPHLPEFHTIFIDNSSHLPGPGAADEPAPQGGGHQWHPGRHLSGAAG